MKIKKVVFVIIYTVIQYKIFVTILLLELALRERQLEYFTSGIASVGIVGIAAALWAPTIGHFYIEHIIESLYLGLFLMAIIPVILNKRPFTVQISEKDYPDVIVRSSGFLKINYLMSTIWSLIFVACIFLTSFHYSNVYILQTLIAIFAPIIFLLTVGLPMNKFLPTYLMRNASYSGVSRSRFQEQADYFWKRLDGKLNYLNEVPKIKADVD
jgi:hypothetical protein